MHECKQGFGKSGKAEDKFPIKVAEPYKGSDCFDASGGGPFVDGLEFCGVHFDGPRRDAKPEVFAISRVKEHLESFKARCSSRRCCNTWRVHLWWRARSPDKCISMSSM